MKAPRYTFRVVIEQIEPEQKRDFGTAEEWAHLIKLKLDEGMQTADVVKVVEVRPVRNTR